MHWGSRFDEEARCFRHREHACPSCLAYALGDANAALRETRTALDRIANMDVFDPKAAAETMRAIARKGLEDSAGIPDSRDPLRFKPH
jgi:DNA-binding SARP family transcriptional activator